MNGAGGHWCCAATWGRRAMMNHWQSWALLWAWLPKDNLWSQRHAHHLRCSLPANKVSSVHEIHFILAVLGSGTEYGHIQLNFIPYNDNDALFSPLHYLPLLFVIKQILSYLLNPSLWRHKWCFAYLWRRRGKGCTENYPVALGATNQSDTGVWQSISRSAEYLP